MPVKNSRQTQGQHKNMFQINITEMPIKCWHLTGISINIQANKYTSNGHSLKISNFDM